MMKRREDMLDFINFLDFRRLSNLMKQKTCYKKPGNSVYINLILVKCHRSLQSTNMFETGLFDFHQMTVSVFNSHFPKKEPRIFSFHRYKSFRNNTFKNELDSKFLNFG